MAPNFIPKWLQRDRRDRRPGEMRERGKSAAPADPRGRSGTVNVRGFISEEETERDLQWPTNLGTYEMMRREDPSVHSMLALVQTPIRATDWVVNPGGAEDEHEEHAAFIEEVLFGSHLEGGFDEWLRQALDYLAFGHMIFERIAELREVHFAIKNPKTGEEKQIEREAFVLARLGPRLPRTINRWITEDDNPAVLVAIEQQLADGMPESTVEIPADRLVLLTHERQGDDFRGLSLLRAAYRPWKYKKRLENIEAIALERTAGLPILYPPEGVDADDPILDDMEMVLRGIRQGEELWAIMPGPKQRPDGEGWLLEEVQITGSDASFSEPISRYEAAMSRNILAEFMRLGHEQTGARAVGDVQQDPYYQAIEAVVGYVESVINEQIVKPLIDWNYDTEVYPEVSASKVQAKNIEKIASFFQSLSGGGFVTPGPELEEWFRQLADAPELPPLAEGEARETGAVNKAPWEPWGSTDKSKPTETPGEGDTQGEAEATGAPAPTDENVTMTQAVEEALAFLRRPEE